jgi:hypothetical protein
MTRLQRAKLAKATLAAVTRARVAAKAASSYAPSEVRERESVFEIKREKECRHLSA